MAYLAPEEEKRKRMIEAMAGSLAKPKDDPQAKRLLMVPDKTNSTMPSQYNWPTSDILPNETPEAVLRRAKISQTWSPNSRQETGRVGLEPEDAQTENRAAIKKPWDTSYDGKPDLGPLDRGYVFPTGASESGLTLPDVGPVAPQPVKPGSVRIGVGAKGITGLDKAMADLDTRRQADTQYKSDINTSDPNFTEINPPKMHKHGLGDTLKSLGRTALLTTGEYARTHPGASTAELLSAAATGGGIGAISPQLGDAMLRKAQIGQAERDIVPQLGIEKEKAQIDALQAKPGTQQSAQNEKAINDALSQYNRLESYDPEDPADAGLRALFEAKGLKLPAKTKYHRPVATWANGQLILTDASGTKAAELNGTPVVDETRKPNAQGLTPSQAATQTNQAANRTAANTRSANQIAAGNTRAANAQTGADRRAAGRTRTGRTTAGDPNQMYQKASDMWAEAQKYREQAKGSNDYLEKQSLTKRADDLEKQTRSLQLQADKLPKTQTGPTKLDPEIAIKRATAKAKRALTAEEEAAIRAEVDRRNRQ